MQHRSHAQCPAGNDPVLRAADLYQPHHPRIHPGRRGRAASRSPGQLAPAAVGRHRPPRPGRPRRGRPDGPHPPRGVPGARATLRDRDLGGYRYATQDQGLLGGLGAPQHERLRTHRVPLIVFDPSFADQYAGRISLLNDPRETLGAALNYLGYSLNTTDTGELEEAKQLVAEARGRVAAFDTDRADELLTTGETAIAHGYSGDMFTQFLETDDPSRYVYFVPEEGGTRWIDNMAIPHDAPNPCTAHTFNNWILGAENGAAVSNYNYYSTPNAAALDGLEQELLDFVADPAVIPGGVGSLEEIQDTGDFEINYTDAFIEAVG
ncbi:MAG: extracellular solute-binding protein [Acidimicrobiia bacterium]|nr:extracellular solute-binding protein [Acidimicrobiia bacterium]